MAEWLLRRCLKANYLNRSDWMNSCFGFIVPTGERRVLHAYRNAAMRGSPRMQREIDVPCGPHLGCYAQRPQLIPDIASLSDPVKTYRLLAQWRYNIRLRVLTVLRPIIKNTGGVYSHLIQIMHRMYL